MSNFFRPSIAKKFYIEKVIDTSTIKISLQKALEKNSIVSINNARLIHFNNQSYYQIKKIDESILYLSTNDGSIVNQLDKKYAEYLARYFLNDYQSPINSIELITEYTTFYKPINRLLPVYKVSFNNNDNTDIYVDTRASRLGTFNNQYRKAHIWIFHTFHNWGIIPNNFLKSLLVSLFSLLALLTAVAGVWIYGLGFKNFKQQKIRNEHLKKRKSHRAYGIIFSIFCLMFAFSGFYHATKKFTPDNRHLVIDKQIINTKDLRGDLSALVNLNKAYNFSLQKINNIPYYRINSKKGKHSISKHYNTNNSKPLLEGDKLYCKELASKYSGLGTKKIQKISIVKKFKGEYGFVNKLLPVYKIDFNTSNHLSYYIEPKTGKLASKVTDSDRLEGFSFAFLHKFHFLDALGRTPRDIIAIMAALSMLLVAFKGWKLRRRKR
ncbi:PepSY domain-containing protein [Pseudofulvibacter geojedonensis]|uniref:PepSY domain-containing protein n=1 Tax=Pseudofulvibacter geojedonensis TaxID=1123758 RepID=A0ABW3HYS9_9FLAO